MLQLCQHLAYYFCPSEPEHKTFKEAVNPWSQRIKKEYSDLCRRHLPLLHKAVQPQQQQPILTQLSLGISPTKGWWNALPCTTINKCLSAASSPCGDVALQPLCLLSFHTPVPSRAGGTWRLILSSCYSSPKRNGGFGLGFSIHFIQDNRRRKEGGGERRDWEEKQCLSAPGRCSKDSNGIGLGLG